MKRDVGELVQQPADADERRKARGPIHAQPRGGEATLRGDQPIAAQAHTS
jgi:hypothetical protein